MKGPLKVACCASCTEFPRKFSGLLVSQYMQYFQVGQGEAMDAVNAARIEIDQEHYKPFVELLKYEIGLSRHSARQLRQHLQDIQGQLFDRQAISANRLNRCRGNGKTTERSKTTCLS